MSSLLANGIIMMWEGNHTYKLDASIQEATTSECPQRHRQVSGADSDETLRALLLDKGTLNRLSKAGYNKPLSTVTSADKGRTYVSTCGFLLVSKP